MKPLPADAKCVFRGVMFEVWQWQQRMYDGSTATFERLKRPNTAQIIAAVGDTIMVQEQEQPDTNGSFLDIPSGRCEEGEDPLETAKRELIEESGYASDDWSLWKETRPVSKIEWTVYTYVARNCRKVAEPQLDAGERIHTRFLDLDDFLALPDDPRFRASEVVDELFRMRLDSKKREAFRKTLFG